ncbi:MAG: polyprenyl synthetase family protein [Bacteroidales bacterium]|nr:polyprenyl synthetase family protein [Bacteroidales bacterium]
MITDAAIDIAVKKLFDEIEFTKEPAGLYDPLRYMIAIGGKRIRPRLCMIAYALFKDELGDELLQPASALEVFHSFTLIHDDIMDRSPLRRGVPTVWKKWNSDTAILSGDVMLIDAYRRIAMAPASCHAEVLGLFTKTAAEVCDGQQFDMDFENEAQVPMADYMKMIGLKTAVLIACAAKMGALIAGASQKDADALYEYGYQLGLAFQVADDYLDAYGDEKVFGKPIGGDIVNDKKSWMVIRALEKASDRQALLEKMAMPSETEEQRKAKIDAVKAVYDAEGVAEDAKSEIARLTGLALAALERLDVPSERIQMLHRFADSLIGRAK